MRRVLVSRPALSQLDALPSKERRRVVRGLEALGEDPFTPRSGCDIKKLEGGEPPKYRLRVGEWRAVYAVTPSEVRVLQVFRRGHGYRIE